MNRKVLRKTLALTSALAMLSGMAFYLPAETFVSAETELLGETSFDYKMIPWRPFQAAPAKQISGIDKGTLHVMIINPDGYDHEQWDMGICYRNLDFKAGHKYKVTFSAKAKREGMELFSHISNIYGDEEYFELDSDKMHNGPHMGGEWGSAAVLTSEWQTFSGEFTPKTDIENAEWRFQYARGLMYGGNAVQGDELWFDNISVTDMSDSEQETSVFYGLINRNIAADRYYSKTGEEIQNYISVNQLGYLPENAKVAVLSDNKGDFSHNSSSIELSEDQYEFEVCSSKTGKTVYKGTSGHKITDSDSGDNVFKLDFSELKTPGTYYIKSGDYRSFEFRIANDIYNNAILRNTLNYFYLNRSGCDIEEQYITSGDKSSLSHEACYKCSEELVPAQDAWIDDYYYGGSVSQHSTVSRKVSGGWHDAADHRQNVVSGGSALWTLLNMYEMDRKKMEGINCISKFASAASLMSVPESGNRVPDILEEAAYELDWMSEMTVPEDDPVWGEFAGLLYSSVQNSGYTDGPVFNYEAAYGDDFYSERIIKPPTFAATLNYAACAAQAARLWIPYNREKAQKYFEDAKKAYEAYKLNYYPANQVMTSSSSFGEVPMESLDEKSLYNTHTAGTYGQTYTDLEVSDDAYWAECELYVTARAFDDENADDYYKALSSYKNSDTDGAFGVSTVITGGDNLKGSRTSFNWGNMAAAGSLTLALHKSLLSEKDAEKLNENIIRAADEYIEIENKQGYGTPYEYDGDGIETEPYSNFSPVISGYNMNSNVSVLNNAIVMAYADLISNDSKYDDGIISAMNYILGTNPLSVSYVTGYGVCSVQNPVNIQWTKEIDKSMPAAPSGVLSSGPNAFIQDSYIRGLGFVQGKETNYSQRCFADSVESWSTNSASLSGNASLSWLVSYLSPITDHSIEKEEHTEPIITTAASETEPAVTTTASESRPVVTTKVSESGPVVTTKVSESGPVVTTRVSESGTVVTTAVSEPAVSGVSSAAVTTVTKSSETKPVKTDISVTSPVVSTDSDDVIPSENSSSAGSHITGDVNLDGKVDISDLSLLAVNLADKISFSKQSEINADVDNDGIVRLSDLARIRQYLSHIIEKF